MNLGSFSGYTFAYTYGITVGTVSKSIYYMHWVLVSSTNGAVIRKVNSDYSEAWIASFPFYPAMKSLMVDINEQHLYFSSWTNPQNLLQLSATTGAVELALNL